jgi:hypothetical protein
MKTKAKKMNLTHKPTECKCPQCEKTHIKLMFWTGRGMPHKYCRLCALSLDEIDNYGSPRKTPDYYESQYPEYASVTLLRRGIRRMGY